MHDGKEDNNEGVVQEEGKVECSRVEKEKEDDGNYVPDSRMNDKKLLAFVRQKDKVNTVVPVDDQHDDNEHGHKEGKRMPKLCWFGMNCYRGSKCTFSHSNEYASPPPCRYEKCTRDDCVFKHADDCKNRSNCAIPGCAKRHVKKNQQNLRMMENVTTCIEDGATALVQTQSMQVSYDQTNLGLSPRPQTADPLVWYKYPVKRLSQFYRSPDSDVSLSNRFHSNMSQEKSLSGNLDPKNWTCR